MKKAVLLFGTLIAAITCVARIVAVGADRPADLNIIPVNGIYVRCFPAFRRHSVECWKGCGTWRRQLVVEAYILYAGRLILHQCTNSVLHGEP